MTGKVVLKENNLPVRLVELCVPISEPLLIYFRGHPGLSVVAIKETE
jgi:hypothetical protein